VGQPFAVRRRYCQQNGSYCCNGKALDSRCYAFHVDCVAFDIKRWEGKVCAWTCTRWAFHAIPVWRQQSTFEISSDTACSFRWREVQYEDFQGVSI
jgi:hypothetical protein